MKWADVIKQPNYKKGTLDEKIKWRDEYFELRVMPQIKGDPTEYRKEFYQYTESLEPEFLIAAASKDFPTTATPPKVHPEIRHPEGLTAVEQPYSDFPKALKIGFQESATGLAARESPPDPYEPAGWEDRFGRSLGTIAGDLPFMAAGGLIGGAALNPVTAAMGAFALPTAVKETLRPMREKGALSTPEEFVERASNTLYESLKSGNIGALVGGVNKLPLPKRAKFPAEMATMIGGESALSRELPTAEGVMDTALTLGALHGLSKVSKKSFKKEPQVNTFDKYWTPEYEGQAPPIRSIVDYLRKEIDVPIEKGKFRQKAEGIYQKTPEVIRVKKIEDIETISHEIGHHIQNKLNLDTKKYLNEISHLASWGDPKQEGFAEFFRLYFTNRKIAKRESPELYKDFETKLNDHPELKQVFDDVKLNLETFKKSSPEERFRSHIIRKPIKKREGLEHLLEESYTGVVDRIYPIKKIGRALGEQEDITYKMARRFEGAAGIPETFLRKETFAFHNKEKRTGKPLYEILKPLKKELENFEDYIVARRAMELIKRKKITGFEKKDVNAVLKTHHSEKFNTAFKELKKYQDKVLEYLKDSGVLSQEAFNKIGVMNKDYVPFHRLMEQDSGRGTQGFANLGKGVYRFGGADNPIHSPLESIIKNTYALINLAERNRVGQQVAKWTEIQGAGKYIRKVPASLKPLKLQVDEVLKSVDPEMAKIYKELDLPEAALIFRPDFNPKLNEIRVWQEGKPVLYEVEPSLYKTMTTLNGNNTGLLLKLLSLPAKSLRAGATFMNPEFIMGRNPIRDQITAFLYSQSGYKPGIDMLSGLMSMVKKDKYYWDFKKYGGEHVALASLDRTYLRMKLKDVVEGKTSLKNVVNPVEALRIVGSHLEGMTRLGEAKKYIKKFGETAESKAEGAFRGRDVTLDFMKKGGNEQIQALTMLTAFMNPQIQGLDKMVNAFKTNPEGTLVKTLSVITLPSLVLWNHNKDKEWYKNIDQWQKDLFWLAGIGGTDEQPDLILRIPKPFEIGVLFGSVPERILDYRHEKTPHKINEVFKTLGETLTPPIMPTAIQIPYELMSNYSSFYDRSIEPTGLKDVLPAFREGRHDPELTKKLGQLTGLSPSKINYAIHGLTGGGGMALVKKIDDILVRTGAFKIPPKPEKAWSDVPFVKSFVARYPSSSSSGVHEMYKNIDISVKTFNTFKKLLKTNQADRAMQFFQNNISALTFATGGEANPEATFEEVANNVLILGESMILSQARSFISKMNSMADLIINSQNMSPKQKKSKLDRMYIQTANLARDINSRIYQKRNE